ncbi:MAG TPA: thiol:disulfide interchange protein DsbA/DsbL [Pseudoxanthomonas sp.]
MIRTFRILALFCAFLPLLAAHAAPQVDVEYKLIKPAQPVMGKNVEVIEFFAYACPHCAEFEPALQSWLKRKPKDVDYRPVPMIFRAEWKPGAKLYYTLETMGVVEKYHQKIYDASHKQGKQLTSDEAVKDWAKSAGVDSAKFNEVYDSFAVDTKVQRAITIGRSYGVQFTPSLAVNGKYYTGPSMAGGNDYAKFFGVLDQLIDMERHGAK